MEARALQPGVRPDQRPAHRRLASSSARTPPQPDWISTTPLGVDHRRAGLAVDAVHDADPAGRAAEPPAGRHRGGPDRRRHAVADLPLHDLPAPAPVPGARRACSGRSTSCRTSTPSSPSPPAAWAPPTCRTRSTRSSTHAHDYGRASAAGVVVVDRHDHHRDLRAAHRLVPVPGGEPADEHHHGHHGAARARRTRPAPGAQGSRRATATLLGLLAWIVGILFVTPGAVDGADLVPLRDRRGDQPAVARSRR